MLKYIQRIKRFLRIWGALYLYMGFMWYLSSKPFRIPFFDFPYRDKIVHILEYSVFGYLLTRAFSINEIIKPGVLFAFAIMALSLSWGIIDEIHQSYVPSRNPEMLDVVCDVIGAMAGCHIFAKGSFKRFVKHY